MPIISRIPRLMTSVFVLSASAPVSTVKDRITDHLHFGIQNYSQLYNIASSLSSSIVQSLTYLVVLAITF